MNIQVHFVELNHYFASMFFDYNNVQFKKGSAILYVQSKSHLVRVECTGLYIKMDGKGYRNVSGQKTKCI